MKRKVNGILNVFLFFLILENIIGQTLVNLNTAVTGTCEWKFESGQGRMEILNCDLNNGNSGPYTAEGAPLKYTAWNKQCGTLTGNYDQVTFFYTVFFFSSKIF